MPRSFKFIITIFVALYLLSTSFFVVRENEFAKVLTLNSEVSRVIRAAGLYWKFPAPFQTVQYVDARIISLAKSEPDMMQTRDKKNLLIDYYVRLRIEDPLRFQRAFPGLRETSTSVHTTVLSHIREFLNRSINTHDTSEIISKDRDAIQNQVLSEENKAFFLNTYGIQLVDVRIRRVDFQPEILTAVFTRMSTERIIAARESRTQGEARKSELMAEGRRESDVLISTANSESLKIRGAGDAEAAAIYANAYQQDPAFFKFYRSLQAYRDSFQAGKDTIVVDPSSEFFKYMKGSGE